VVACAASIGFLIGLGSEGFLLPIAGALLVGGLIAAPIAAWLVRVVPAQLLGATIGGVIVLTNARTLMRSADLDGPTRPAVYALLAVVWAAAFALAVRALLHTRRGRAVAATDAAYPAGDAPLRAADPIAPLPERVAAADQLAAPPTPHLHLR